MKRISLALLCLLLVGLFACEQVKPKVTTTAPTTIQEVTSSETETETDASVSTTTITAPENTATAKPPTLSASNTEGLDDNEFKQYSRVIKKYIKDKKTEIKYYALYNINDGKPVLLLGADGVYKRLLYRIYAIQNGNAVQQELFWSDIESPYTAVLLSNCTIMRDGDNDGDLIFSYYKFEDGELKVYRLKNCLGDYYWSIPEVEDPPITKEEFDRAQKEFEGDGQVVEIDWKPLAEFGR